MSTSRFDRYLNRRETDLNTKLVLALDLSTSLYSLPQKQKKQNRETLFEKARSILAETEPYLAGVKINYPLLWSLGPDLLSKLIAQFELPKIGDFKVADIDNTSRLIAEQAYDIGFEAVIAHPFLGYSGGLDSLFKEARERDRGVVLVINMSHPGSQEFITPRAGDLAQFAVDHSAQGVIAPATRPAEVTQAREWVGPEMTVLTPGIGAQGGQPGDAIKAGADYEIVGRAIYQSEHPAEAARRIRDDINEVVSQ